MTMMHPEPEAEFRREKEFRAKIYRMLSLGLSTTEIEGLIGRKVDWQLFSQETLSTMMKNENASIGINVDYINQVIQAIDSYLTYILKYEVRISTLLLCLAKDLSLYFWIFLGFAIVWTMLGVVAIGLLLK